MMRVASSIQRDPHNGSIVTGLIPHVIFSLLLTPTLYRWGIQDPEMCDVRHPVQRHVAG